jgi:hypothetical protein
MALSEFSGVFRALQVTGILLDFLTLLTDTFSHGKIPDIDNDSSFQELCFFTDIGKNT